MNVFQPVVLQECSHVRRHGGVRVRLGVRRAPVVAHVEGVDWELEVTSEAASQAAPVGLGASGVSLVPAAWLL